MTAERPRVRHFALWIAAALALAFATRFDGTTSDPAAVDPAATAEAVAAPAPKMVRPSEPARAVQPPPSAPAPVALARVAPAGDPELDGHPHPITAEHVRIQRELQLIQQLNDALDLRDATQLRALIAEYARHVPGDPNALAAGYERIADCLDHPGTDAQELAREYYLRERASTLRRYVRRVCFDDQPVEAAKL